MNDQNSNAIEPTLGTTEVIEVESIMTNDQATGIDISRRTAKTPHVDSFQHSPDPFGCALRLRLTSSEPFRVGSVFHRLPVFVLTGFETAFSFQVFFSFVCWLT